MAGGLTSYGLPTMPENAAEADLRLFRAWNSSTGFNKDKALTELLDHLQGAIMTAVNTYSSAPLPKVTMELQAKQFAVESLRDFDPGRGVPVANYVINAVKQKLYRYVGTYQNVARIPEHLIRQIGPLNEANAELTSRFGREPTVDELSDHMGVTTSHVTDLRRLLRKDLTEEGGGGVDQFEAFEHDPDFERASMAYYSLTSAEKQVYDFSLGAHGQPQLGNNEIAGRMGVSAGRISQLKKSLAEKLKPYLTGAP